MKMISVEYNVLSGYHNGALCHISENRIRYGQVRRESGHAKGKLSKTSHTVPTYLEYY